MNKKRGKFLTIMIVFSVIGIIEFIGFKYLSTLSYIKNVNLVLQPYETVPYWFSLYQIVIQLISILSIIGLWMMKKWGVYLWFLTTFVSLIIAFFVLKPLGNVQFLHIPISIVTDISSIALWYWAISRKWKSFS